MAEKVQVDINEIIKLKTRLAEINHLDFNDIEFVENGKPIVVDEDLKADFTFTGLNNVDYIWSGYYLEKNDEIHIPQL